jgi:hypothetical protein
MSYMTTDIFWPTRDDPPTLANLHRRPHMVLRAALLLVGSANEWPELRLPRNTRDGNRTARIIEPLPHDESVVAGRRWSPLGTMAIVRLTERHCRVHPWKVNFRVRHVPPLFASIARPFGKQ